MYAVMYDTQYVLPTTTGAHDVGWCVVLHTYTTIHHTYTTIHHTMQCMCAMWYHTMYLLPSTTMMCIIGNRMYHGCDVMDH